MRWMIGKARGTARADAHCPLCEARAESHAEVERVAYFACRQCDFIFADPAMLERVDAGEPLREYDAAYWESELASARQRAWGSSLARAAEALLYCSIPVRNFLDIGTGPGYLLDALTTYLPSHRDRFHGVEKFPPPPTDRSTHPNYIVSDLRDVDATFECGTCIEVLEHLTPAMARALAQAMAKVSADGALFVVNTGLTEYVRKEDPGYLDPWRRGHITCWSVAAAAKVFAPAGFAVHPLGGKTWAFAVEKLPARDARPGPLRDRIWHAPEDNRRLLADPRMGEVMYLLGIESARAY
jgi:hypothetical protein